MKGTQGHHLGDSEAPHPCQLRESPIVGLASQESFRLQSTFLSFLLRSVRTTSGDLGLGVHGAPTRRWGWKDLVNNGQSQNARMAVLWTSTAFGAPTLAAFR